MILVMNSQCLYGKIDFTLYETGKLAQKLHVIPAGDMTDACAMARLTAILSISKDDAQIKKYMMFK